MLAVVAGLLAWVGAAAPKALSLCFEPGDRVCPTGGTEHTRDIAIVELMGLLGAAIAAVSALRRARGTAAPFSVPIVLSLLKLPTGALSAVLGLLLISGEVVPGLSELDTSGQIIAWAVLLGAGQQLFMHLVDRQAGMVLDNVGRLADGTADR